MKKSDNSLLFGNVLKSGITFLSRVEAHDFGSNSESQAFVVFTQFSSCETN